MLRSHVVSAINPAFFQEIKDDSVQLWELLDATRDALSVCSADRIQTRALADLLAQLKQQLSSHFVLEEFYGYFDDALGAVPHLVDRAQVLKLQHDPLYTKLADIADDCSRLANREITSTSLATLMARYRAFYDELSSHETAERQLITDSLYDEIGTGD
jgi:hypothetical protein